MALLNFQCDRHRLDRLAMLLLVLLTGFGHGTARGGTVPGIGSGEPVTSPWVVTLDGIPSYPAVPEELSRDYGDYLVEIRRTGFEPESFLARRVRDGWLWGCIVLRGRSALALDFSPSCTSGQNRNALRERFEGAAFSGKGLDGNLVYLKTADLDAPVAATSEDIALRTGCPVRHASPP